MLAGYFPGSAGRENRFSKKRFNTATRVCGTITQLDSLVRHSILNANRAQALEPSAAFGENEESKRRLKQLSALKVDKLCICAFDFLHSVKVIKIIKARFLTLKYWNTFPNILY